MRDSRRWRAGVLALGVAVVLAGGCESPDGAAATRAPAKDGLTTGTRGGEASASQTAAEVSGRECPQGSTASCVRTFGEREVTGRCVQGWCMSLGPGCLHDVECFGVDQCVERRCVEGRCVAEDRRQAPCERGGEPGVCRSGLCELPAVERPPECTLPDAGVGEAEAGLPTGDAGLSDEPASGDCPSAVNPCLVASCVEGRCDYRQRVDGAACKTGVKAPGRCLAARCVLDEGGALDAVKRCKTITHRSIYGRYKRRKCTTSLRYRLSEAKLEAAREKLRKAIEREVRYDVAIGLVAQPEGGYNINVVNARARTEIRGLIDPSFVAFSLAGFTSKTDWKSRQLTIWLDGLTEGWSIPTSGGRKALRKGRRASGLGLFGVVDVRVYRKWLEQTFRAVPATRAQAVVLR